MKCTWEAIQAICSPFLVIRSLETIQNEKRGEGKVTIFEFTLQRGLLIAERLLNDYRRLIQKSNYIYLQDHSKTMNFQVIK